MQGAEGTGDLEKRAVYFFKVWTSAKTPNTALPLQEGNHSEGTPA